MLCRAVPCCAMLCHAVPCCAELCHAVPCCAVLCCYQTVGNIKAEWLLVSFARTGDAAARIEQLLIGSITSSQEASRLCAAQWANRLFPFQHVPARYICTLAAGDIKLEIREEGQSGLNPPKPQPGLELLLLLPLLVC